MELFFFKNIKRPYRCDHLINKRVLILDTIHIDFSRKFFFINQLNIKTK